MLVKLFDPSWLRSLPAGDQKLVELVCEHAGALERLIADNAGSMDKELIEYFSRASAHFRILQLAYKGELGTDATRFAAYVYPKQLDRVLAIAVERLNRRAADLRANPGASPEPIAPLVLTEDERLDDWPDPDGRLHAQPSSALESK